MDLASGTPKLSFLRDTPHGDAVRPGCRSATSPFRGSSLTMALLMRRIAEDRARHRAVLRDRLRQSPPSRGLRRTAGGPASSSWTWSTCRPASTWPTPRPSARPRRTLYNMKLRGAAIIMNVPRPGYPEAPHPAARRPPRANSPPSSYQAEKELTFRPDEAVDIFTLESHYGIGHTPRTSARASTSSWRRSGGRWSSTTSVSRGPRRSGSSGSASGPTPTCGAS